MHASILLAVSLSYLSYVFDIFHNTFWQSGLGDWIDPYFINYLLEHWYRSVTSFSDPSSPPMYFPIQKTLGYSHGLILYAPFYVSVRPFLHPFQAYSLSLFVVIETGIVCLYLIFRKFYQLSFVESLLLSAFFFTSQNAINGTVGVWSQRASVFLIPPIVLILLTAVRDSGRPQMALAALSGLLATLLFAHDFYTAQFALFFVLVLLAPIAFIANSPTVTGKISGVWNEQRLLAKVAVVTTIVGSVWALWVGIFGGGTALILGVRIASRDWRRPALLVLVSVIVLSGLRGPRRITADLLAVPPWVRALLFGAAMGSAVFLWMYLPAYREHRSFPLQDLLHTLTVRHSSRWVSPIDAIRDLGTYGTLRSFKWICLLSALSWAPWLKVDRRSRLGLLWAVAVSVLVLAIPLQVDGRSIWLMLFHKLPGFSVIRDPTRIIYLFELAVVLFGAWLLARLPPKSVYRVGVSGLLLLFMVTDHHTEVFDYERPVGVYRRWVESPIDVDPACRSFFIKGASTTYMSRSPNMLWALYNVDAMFVSLHHGLPTLNGYSAWAPDGWNLFNPQDPDYPAEARRWIAEHALRNVCEFDIESHTMRLVTR